MVEGTGGRNVIHTKIKGSTCLYAVIGDPIAHSISPELHNQIFERMGVDKVYMPLRIRPQDLKHALPLLRDNLKGFNVTIPHKQEIMKYIDDLDERARAYGAVNTVKVEDGKLKGYNTDGLGFMMSLEREKIDLEHKRIWLAGAGGSARVVAYELLQKGCSVTIANRSEKRGQQLAAELEERTGSRKVKSCRIEDIQPGYDIIINATPVGMHPFIDEMPIKEELLEGAALVYDLVYNPDQTKLLRTAAAKGIKTINGFPMLFYQAIKAQEIWMGEPLRDDITDEVFIQMKEYLLKKR